MLGLGGHPEAEPEQAPKAGCEGCAGSFSVLTGAWFRVACRAGMLRAGLL